VILVANWVQEIDMEQEEFGYSLSQLNKPSFSLPILPLHVFSSPKINRVSPKAILHFLMISKIQNYLRDYVREYLLWVSFSSFI